MPAYASTSTLRGIVDGRKSPFRAEAICAATRSLSDCAKVILEAVRAGERGVRPPGEWARGDACEPGVRGELFARGELFSP